MRRILAYLPLTIIIMLFAALPATAQQIQGQVRYAESNQPAINVTVRCEGIGGSSIQMTDSNGKFFFRVSPGHYSVTVNIPGYNAEEQSADLTDTNSNEYFFFRLKSNGTAKTASPTVINANVPEAARKEFEKGEAALAGGKKEQLQQAIPFFEKAVTLYPAFVEAQLKVGTTYMDLQQWDKAEIALKKVLEIDPKVANAYFALGEVYLHQKKYDPAEKALQDGLAIEARSAQAHFTLARVYWDKVAGAKEEAQWRPSLEKAYQEVKQALELDPNLAAAHLLKGNLYFKVRRAEDAEKEFEEYLRLDPNGEFAPQTRELVEKIKKALAQQKKP